MRNAGSRKYVQSYSPKLCNDVVRALKWGERYRYLGVDTGRERLKSLTDLRDRVLMEVKKVTESLLTDWQKLDYINMFIISKFSYQLRAALPLPGWARDLDIKIRALVKKALGLPRRVATPFLYLNTPGGLGLYSVLDNLTIARISHFDRCLNSKDLVVRSVARRQLLDVLKIRSGCEHPGNEEVESFLNSVATVGEGKVGDVKSLWSRHS